MSTSRGHEHLTGVSLPDGISEHLMGLESKTPHTPTGYLILNGQEYAVTSIVSASKPEVSAMSMESDPMPSIEPTGASHNGTGQDGQEPRRVYLTLSMDLPLETVLDMPGSTVGTPKSYPLRFSGASVSSGRVCAYYEVVGCSSPPDPRAQVVNAGSLYSWLKQEKVISSTVGYLDTEHGTSHESTEGD